MRISGDLYETFLIVLAGLLLGVSIYTYVTGDAALHLMSYQGPIVAGGIIGWLTVMRANKGRVYSPSVTEELMPVIGLIYRKYSPILIVMGSILASIWLIPSFYRLEVYDPFYFVISFLSELVGGFLVGIALPSLKFIEKIILYSIALGADLFYVFLIYISSTLFGVSESVVVIYVLAMVFLVKAPEGVALALYIAKRVRMI